MIYTDYFKDFKCKCGECRHVCCGGWGITVSDEEYFRLLGLDCPPSLRYILDCALAQADDPSPERFAVMKPSYTGVCRLVDENGLCSLQVACGEDVLPAVCRTYPRAVSDGSSGCSASCERVVELLLRDKPLSFSEEPPGRCGIRLMQNRALSLEERVNLLYTGPQVDNDALFDRLCGVFSDISEPFSELCLTERARYNGEYDTFFENLIVNRMFISGYPGGDGYAASAGVYCEYLLLTRLLPGAADEIQLVDRTASLYRFIGHSRFDKNCAVVINSLREVQK